MKISKKKFKILAALLTLFTTVLIGTAFFLLKKTEFNPLKKKSSGLACYWIDTSTGLSCNQSTTLQGRSFYFNSDQNKLNAACSNTKIAVTEKRLGSGTDTKDCTTKFKTQCNEKDQKITFKKPNTCVCEQLTTLQPCEENELETDLQLQCTGIEIINTNNQLLTEGKYGYLKNQPLYVKMYYQKPINNEDEYNYYLRINNQDVNIPTGAVKKHTDNTYEYLEITWTISNLPEAQTISLQSFALDNLNKKHTSKLCNIVIPMEAERKPLCSSLNIYPTSIDFSKQNPVQIDSIVINTLNTEITEKDNCQITFEVTTNGKTDSYTTKDSVCDYFKSNSFIFDTDYLYNAKNFTNNKPFPSINKKEDNILITVKAAIKVNETQLENSKCSGTSTNATTKSNQDNNNITEISDTNETEKSATLPTNTCLNGCLDIDEVCDPSATNESANIKGCTADPNYSKCNIDCTLSNNNIILMDSNVSPEQQKGEAPILTTYSISQTTPACMANQPGYTIKPVTIVITNTGSNPGGIIKVTDKLPQGMTYVTNSLKINGELPDPNLLSITTVGSTQQLDLVPTSNWELAPNDSLTISFNIGITGNAEQGTKQNEITITPTNIDSNTNLYSTKDITIKAACSSVPDTGIFDSTIIKVIIGILLVILGYIYYKSATATTIAKMYISSNTYQNIKLVYLKLTQPFAYFEEKVLHDIQKKKTKKTQES